MNLDEFWGLFNRGERNFQGCVIQDVNFDGIDFHDVDFSNADLSNSRIRKTTFEKCSFTNANFGGCNVECVSFTNCQLIGSNFTSCMIEELAFNRCNLSESKFISAQMDVYFFLSNLSKSQWQQTDWSGGLTECNLTEAQMNDMFARKVQIVNTIYPNGVSGDLSWYDVRVKGEPPTPKASIIVHNRNLIELKSAVGMDYSVLRDLLSECRWIAAQEKTHESISNLLGGDDYYLRPELIAKIPCVDLMTIDLLWESNSWGQFGFSIQKEIWVSICRGHTCNSKDYNIFRKQIWNKKINERKKLKDEKAIKQVPAGCFPDTASFFLLNEQEEGLANFYCHLSECQSG
jgi:hypothetical protein